MSNKEETFPYKPDCSPLTHRGSLSRTPTIKDLTLSTAYLQLYPPLKAMEVQVVIMKEKKKDDFYGTCVRKYLTDGTSKYAEQGTIFINLVECKTLRRLCRVLAHEVGHLLDDAPCKNKVYAYLTNKFKGGGGGGNY